MTCGVLIFAYNNEQIDYLAMANWSARNIRRHLNLPVAVVTNIAPPHEHKFEQVIIAKTEGKDARTFNDIATKVTWYNGNRSDAYSLSPWKQTLVLDADYVVASDQLKSLVALDTDFVAHKTAYDVTGINDFNDLNNFGRHKMPMSWATVMMFRRSARAEMIFECMQMVKQNWKHYVHLYGISRQTFRNDFALSIALNIVNGHVKHNDIVPWKLASVTHEHKLKQLSADEYRVDFVKPDGKPHWVKVTGDFHAMGKKHLGDIVANPC